LKSGKIVQSQADQVGEGDIVLAPGDNIGIVIGIYGMGYCEVLINKGTSSARIIPYRQADLKRLPAQQSQAR
jgi:hypothetical protein